jgi:hypothetical protein
MLASSDGCNRSTVGTGATRAATVARFGDGAWHDPPQPQSKPRLSAGAEAVPFVWSSPRTTDAAGVADAVAVSESQSIILPVPAPNNEPSSGS